MSVVVIATIHPVPEHRREVIDAFEAAVARVHVEDEGCLLYARHDADDCLVMIEKWVSAEALDAHGRGPALVELGTRLVGKTIGDTEVQKMRALPAGTAEQGAL